MARDPFAPAAKRILDRLGVDALLRGASAGKVHIEHGAQVYDKGNDGEALFSRSIATIGREYAPKRGDALLLDEDRDGVPEVAYTIGGLNGENAYHLRYIVIPADA